MHLTSEARLSTLEGVKRNGWMGLLMLALTAGTSSPQPERLPSVVSLSFDEAEPIARAFLAERPDVKALWESPTRAASWDEWVTREDERVRQRLLRGEEDAMIHFMLFGTSFTRRPRVTARDLMALSGSTDPKSLSETVADVLRGRIEDLLRALATPGRNERLLWIRHLVQQRGYTISDRPRLRQYIRQVLARVLAEQNALARALQEAERLASPAQEFISRSTLYRTRGLAPDTSLWPNFAIERALQTLRTRGLLRARSVRRVAVIGPGLDFTDKQEGYDFYPLQTLQPFALIETLRRLDLADEPSLQVYALDVSDRVTRHLQRARQRARRGLGYRIHLPLDSEIPWTSEALAFWERFGTEIGTAIAPLAPPSGLSSLRLRAVRIRPDVVLKVIPVRANIIVHRLQLSARDAVDLVIATNVFVYYDAFEQSLALKNIERMLRLGGFLLSNNALPELPTTRLVSLGYQTTAYSTRPKDGDHIVWYRRQEE